MSPVLAPGRAAFDSSLGPWGLAWTSRGVDRVVAPDASRRAVRDALAAAAPDRPATTRPPDAIAEVARRLRAHLAGRPDPLRDAPLDLTGWSPFARRVAHALRRVPPGATITYAELARRAGAPGAARAAGRAMATNPLPLLVPCHRVLPAAGGLGGYSAAGGPALKARLLHREGVVLRPEHEAAAAALARRDRALARVIRRVGPYLPAFGDHRDPYDVLMTSIIHQQLSIKAAATIVRRTRALTPGAAFPTPSEIDVLPDAALRGAGLSRQKIGYLRDLAARVGDGSLALRRLRRMSDDEAVAALCAVKGIGVWTAQMMLIFHMGRIDVWPVDDLGLRKAVGAHLGLRKPPTAREMHALGERWAPFRSVAAWYLWEMVDNAPG